MIGWIAYWHFEKGGAPVHPYGSCPKACSNSAEMRAELGCDTEVEPLVLDDKGALRAPRCPMSYLRDRDAFTSEVAEMASDWDKGILSGWPDAFTAGAVEAVRLLIAERSAARAAADKRAFAKT